MNQTDALKLIKLLKREIKDKKRLDADTINAVGDLAGVGRIDSAEKATDLLKVGLQHCAPIFEGKEVGSPEDVLKGLLANIEAGKTFGAALSDFIDQSDLPIEAKMLAAGVLD